MFCFWGCKLEEGHWELWEGTGSLLERVVDGRRVKVEGSGTLELEEDEEGIWESAVPRGPGQVDFVLLCDFEEFKSPRVEAIKVRLTSRDDGAFRILIGVQTEGLSLLPRYRLSGTITTEQGETPVQMEAAIVDSSFPPLLQLSKTKQATKVVPVGNVTVGSLEGTKGLISCRILVPNFVNEATVEDAGVRVTLGEISTEATHILHASESIGKVQPGSYLEIQRLKEDIDDVAELAIEDFGWLLSFYAGRRIRSVAWEGKTERGAVWRIQNEQLLTPLDGQNTESCVSDATSLEHFLQHAWRAWRNLDEERRTRLRGAVNFYTDLLSATFPTQKLALTTMYLERFRDLTLGSSTLLEAINEDHKKVDTKKLSRCVLRGSTVQRGPSEPSAKGTPDGPTPAYPVVRPPGRSRDRPLLPCGRRLCLAQPACEELRVHKAALGL